ncbi:MAG: hypothetical protein QXY49_04540, partial [Thermofilaceae archaeon]
MSHILILISGISIVNILGKKHFNFLVKLIISYFLGALEFGLLVLIISTLLYPMNYFSSTAIFRMFLITVAILQNLHLVRVTKNELIVEFKLGISLKKMIMYAALIMTLWFFVIYYPLKYLILALAVTDFSIHFRMAVNIIRNPLLLIKVYSSDYPLYHAYLGASMILSNDFDFAHNFIISTMFQQLLLVVAATVYIQAVLRTSNFRSVLLTPLALLIFTQMGWSYLIVYPPPTPD